MRKKSKKSNEGMRKRLMLVARFLVVFNLLSAPMYAIILFDLQLQEFQNLTALLSSSVMSLVGIQNEVDGKYILTPGRGCETVEISWDSTGWKSLYAMFALVLATPLVRLGRKLRYLYIFLPIVFLVNLARVTTTIAVTGAYGCQHFDLLHLSLWRYMLIGVILLLWIVYLKKEKIIWQKTKFINR